MGKRFKRHCITDAVNVLNCKLGEEFNEIKKTDFNSPDFMEKTGLKKKKKKGVDSSAWRLSFTHDCNIVLFINNV